MRARLPWWLLLLWVVLTVVGAAFYVAQDDLAGALIAPALGIFAGIGAMLASRRPHNPLGWLLMSVALLIAVDGLAQGVYGAIEGGSLGSACLSLTSCGATCGCHLRGSG
jgi:hypothetical protein